MEAETYLCIRRNAPEFEVEPMPTGEYGLRVFVTGQIKQQMNL